MIKSTGSLRRRNAFVSIMTVAVLLLAGCSIGGGSLQSKLKYPDAPPSYPMFDTDNLHNESAWNTNNTHDPAIIKEGDTYYVFSTDAKVGGKAKPGIMVRKSKDLIQWDWVGYAFDGVPKQAAEWTGAQGLWAPDVKKFGDTFYLYYSASTFGSNQSFIGVATSSSLEGPWTDQGEVIKTGVGDKPNAIDPNIVLDASGDPWFVFGSFFGGIYTSPLDPKTGKLKEPGFGTKIATRDHKTESGAVEGPYIVYHSELKKYYLFVSFDSLSQDYNVRVGRSDSMTGPYLDVNGRDLMDDKYEAQFEIGNKILGGYKFQEGDGWIAPGHNSVLQDGDHTYIVHHARPQQDMNWMYLHVRKILWTQDGWPVVSPERYTGETVQDIPKASIAGDWERIVMDKMIDGQVESDELKLLKGGKINNSDSKDYWEFDGKHTLTLYWYDGEELASQEIVMMLPSWDWELNRSTLVFTGMNNRGTAIWGKQLPQAAK
ncbi:arabinan endo-1,5-alpha-L-arabinosidase [Paenibacillus sp. V4I5]|nr:arabinan endo-1,5-alpha-L-arabinosidase [Paenibacillus sp. V4I5]